MRCVGYRMFAGMVCLLTAVLPLPVLAEGSTGDDPLVMVEEQDPAMAQAFTKARAGLDTFLALMQKAPEGLSDFAVKVGIRENDKEEFFWLTQVQADGLGFRGLISNKPGMVKGVTLGQQYAFARTQIVDWMYIDRQQRRMMGNYTLCAIISHEPPEKAARLREGFRLQCD